MSSTRYCILPLLLVTASSCLADTRRTAEGYDVSAPLTVPREIFVAYGSAAPLEAEVELEAEDKLQLFPDCTTVDLVAIVHNSPENFRAPAKDAQLAIEPICLRCASSGSAEVKVEGQVSGDELRGSHMHIHGLNAPDRFGLALPEGATGIVELAPKPGEGCFGPKETKDGAARPDARL